MKSPLLETWQRFLDETTKGDDEMVVIRYEERKTRTYQPDETQTYSDRPGMYTAVIHRMDGNEIGHGAAIEIHSTSKEVAEAERDKILTALNAQALDGE